MIKIYAVEYHHEQNTFQSNVGSCLKPENIQVLKIESEQQLADIFTKGLVKSTFEYIQDLIMGW